MSASKPPRRPPAPLDERRLQDLALHYVGRYATTRAKLRTYLGRKLRERGWAGERAPDLEALANRFAELGYIDDAAYALGKAQSLSNRGYGSRRVAEKLRQAGIEADDGAAARAFADQEAVAAALRFAQRRRLGPFAAHAPDPKQREKALGAMVRAGHGFALARAIIALAPGEDVEPGTLEDLAGRGSQ